jgi:pyridoxal phosphate-dependent aminotransferase EpsN
MSKFRIYLSPPQLAADDRSLIQDALDSNWIAPLGPHVDAFEKETASYLGVKAACALNSGTGAIHLALRVLGIKAGDSVLCSTLTFAASANPIVYEKAQPVFVDSEPASWNLCPESLKKAVHALKKEGRPAKALIAVNLYGQSADYDRILPICQESGIQVIEDAAESFGSTYRGRQTGGFGRVGILSFNGNKIITTSGGGMLVSNEPALVEKTRFLATQARDPAAYYLHSEIGFNYRMSNLLAALGRGQLRELDLRVAKRRAIFERYQAGLGELPSVSFMPEIAGGKSSRWLSVMLLDPARTRGSRDGILARLADAGIEARPVWNPMHRQPVYAGAPFFSMQSRPVSETLFERGICLPSGSALTETQQDEVISIIRRELG